MEWWQALSVGMAVLLVLFTIGVPIFVAFLITNVIGTLYFFGARGFSIFTNSIYDTVSSSGLATISLFILMGEVLFRSGATDVVFASMDRLIGRVKGRDFVLSTALGTIFGALSGAAIAVVAMMGRSMLPQMLARGCDRKLSIGSLLAGANLAPIIPPSVLVVVIGMLANVSIAKLLIAGVIPGLLIAALILSYTTIRVMLRPEMAGSGSDDSRRFSFGERAAAVARLLPFTVIIFFVMGFILLGIATPSESAATGVVASLFAAAYYRKLSWKMIKEALESAAVVSAIILAIMATSKLFSQLLALTGSTQAIANLAVGASLDPYIMLLIMMAVPFVLCMFLDQIAISIVFIPMYQPVIAALGFDPIWFWLLFVINMTIGGFSPPFGYVMFALKAAVPDLRMSEIYRAAWPFVAVYLIAMLMIAAFPKLATFLSDMI